MSTEQPGSASRCAGGRGGQVCTKPAADRLSPTPEKPQMNRAFGEPAARLWATGPPFLLIMKSLHTLGHLLVGGKGGGHLGAKY